jgi:Protein of unknown function (DUF1360)
MLLHDHVLENGGASPYSAYRILSGVFYAGVIGLAGATTLLRRFMAPLAPADLFTLGLAAHEIAVIVTEERVTLPLRSPFTTQADHGRDGGHESVPRGQGMQRALGELLTCPHCVAPWIALGLMAGHVVAPLPTRAITTLFTTVALAGAFHHALSWLELRHAAARTEAGRMAREPRLHGATGMHEAASA